MLLDELGCAKERLDKANWLGALFSESSVSTSEAKLMKVTLPRSSYHSLHLVIGTLVLLLCAEAAHGQQTNNGAVDIGPRNPGNAAAGTSPCNFFATPAKFPNTIPNCTDLDQPPSQPPQPAAGGAGNVAGAGTGNPLSGLWVQSINVFETVASVQGNAPSVNGGTEGIIGLGPAFNSNSCVSCHQAPVVGGSSGGIVSITPSNGTQISYTMPLSFTTNPELQAMSDDNNNFNTNPQFPSQFNPNGPPFTDVQPDGPSLEVRLVNGGGTGGFVVPQFGVAELFTIEGRTDAPGCTIPQFNFQGLGNNSISFRIPTPTFGLGLVEATPDQTLVNNLAINNPATAAAAAALGISGTFNRSGNDGTITRFGWKAQNKSLLIFAGEASNVEMGVTNELFPNEKTTLTATSPACPLTTSPIGNQPEDEILPATFASGTAAANIASIISSNAENNAVFMRMNAAPSQCDAVTLLTSDSYGTPGPAQCPPFSDAVTAPVIAGQILFTNNSQTGCALCHSPTLVSGLSQNAALSNQPFHPYSDFAIHDMGPTTNGLADGIIQGGATSEFFRTAPLWGLGQRIFFLHDGRAHDLATAVPPKSLVVAPQTMGSFMVSSSVGP
jgi:CxxC motif-containing protein (DUF1111 family)